MTFWWSLRVKPDHSPPEQVAEQLRLYLAAGGARVWEQAARLLGMPVPSLKKLMDYEWPDVRDRNRRQRCTMWISCWSC